MHARDVRTHNVTTLQAAGFRVSPYLPWSEGGELREPGDIAGRLAALNVYFTFAAAAPAVRPTPPILNYVRTNALEQFMTESERAVINSEREAAQAEHGDRAGWMMENALALAWVLGFDGPLGFDGEMITQEQMHAVLNLTPFTDSGSYLDVVRQLKPRGLGEVSAMEDLFYCCHNAARSAQIEYMESQGKKKPGTYSTVPAKFDPVIGGGVIHERRHALSWALSPDVPWDEVDLST